MKAGFVYDPVYLKHNTGEHVENPKRLKAIISHLEETGLIKELAQLRPRAASIDEIAAAHDKQYIIQIRDRASRGGGWLDADTVISPGSYEAAIYAAGGTIEAVDAVMEGRLKSAFALVRPPGHHATYRQAMGFCLFNNVAIATKYALNRYSMARIAIVDFDVHHGNGTQEAFYSNPQVLYISTHEAPLYPGTGRIDETGREAGLGTTINIPLPAGCGDGEYIKVFEEIITPAVLRFKPELIMVSAGYDAHWSDGIALMEVTVTGFGQMVKIIMRLADELCEGRLVLGLEGGYNLNALAYSVKATFDILLGRENVDDPLGNSRRGYVIGAAPPIDPLIKSIRELHHIR